jgi:hypothetical protein
MNEIEKDYHNAKESLISCGPYLKLSIAIAVFIVIGIPCFVWVLGTLLYFWPVTVPVLLIVVFLAFRPRKGYLK